MFEFISSLPHADILLCIAGMAILTAIPRTLPIMLLAERKLSPVITRWLSFVPVAILSALLAPELLLHDGKIWIAPDNFFLLAVIPALLVSWLTRSFFGSVAAGMATVALLRFVYNG